MKYQRMVAAATWRPSPRDRELHYIAAATVCGYDLTADVFPRAERTKIQVLGRITEWRTKIYSRIPWPRPADELVTLKKLM